MYKTFLEHIRRYEVPPGAPYIAHDPPWHIEEETMETRRTAIRYGMWAIVDLTWTKCLADWIGDRSVLEVMAGAGWLAKALHTHGIDIIATDNNSWNEYHSMAQPIYPIRKMDGLEAVAAHPNRELLLCSWPPYGEYDICQIAKAWGRRGPIIYIGEGQGGCNAPDEFWDHFTYQYSDIAIPRWPGIYDSIYIGEYDGQSGAYSTGW